jgi:hypothetical protein
MQQTPYARLVEAKLRAAKRIAPGKTLNDWLHASRTRGMSWRAIAGEIYKVSGETPTDVTVSSWYEDPGEAAS